MPSASPPSSLAPELGLDAPEAPRLPFRLRPSLTAMAPSKAVDTRDTPMITRYERALGAAAYAG